MLFRSFVSEHSETLVELDIEYRKLAEESGVPLYLRISTVGAGRQFIEGLAGVVRRAGACGGPLYGPGGGRICPLAWGRCLQGTATA